MAALKKTKKQQVYLRPTPEACITWCRLGHHNLWNMVLFWFCVETANSLTIIRQILGTIFFSIEIGLHLKMAWVKTVQGASVKNRCVSMPSCLPHMKLCMHFSILVGGMVMWSCGMPLQLSPGFVNIYSVVYWYTCSLHSCCFRSILIWVEISEKCQGGIPMFGVMPPSLLQCMS